MKNVLVIFVISLFGSMTILYLQGCSSSIPNVELSKSYNFSGKQTITTYVFPSGFPERDETYSRVLYLDLQARGYKIVDANRMLREHSENISGKSFRQIVDSLLTKNYLPQSDIYVVAQPSWDSAYVLSYYSESRDKYWIYYQFSGMYVPTLKSQVAFFDSKIKEPIKRYTASDTTYIFSEDENSQSLFPEYPWMTIAKQVSRELVDIPICSINNSPPADIKIPIELWVDESYRKVFPDSWKERLRLRMLYVNDIFRPQFNVEFVISNFVEWNSKFDRELDNTLEKLHSSVVSNSGVLEIGISLNQELKRNWKAKRELGFAYLLSNNAVITAQPSYPSIGQDWNSIEEALTLVHEIGHIFGAIHVSDKNSIMYPSAGYMTYEFDDVNKKIINATKANFMSKSVAERLVIYSDEMVELKNYPTVNSTPILNPIASVVIQINQRKEILNNDSEKRFTNLLKFFPDSATTIAVMGYLYFKKNNYADAIKSFADVLKVDPEYAEVQYYLGLSLKKEGKKEEAAVYEDLSKSYRKHWVLD